MSLKPANNPDVEAVAVELSIDEKSVTARDGASLYDVISSTGKIIPAMCYHYTFDPLGFDDHAGRRFGGAGTDGRFLAFLHDQTHAAGAEGIEGVVVAHGWDNLARA